jgi:adenine-specific DNA methylase
VASGREKSIRHGLPSPLHLWWARRPLAACRAVLFAQLVDDPSAWPKRFRGEEAQRRERERLHKLIERLVPWQATTDEACSIPTRQRAPKPEAEVSPWTVALRPPLSPSPPLLPLGED